ncbi:hypothetical protein V8C86DRAFT_2938695 [Haematococcus lacustris]
MLPFEGLPLIRTKCCAFSRATSLYALRAGMQAVASGPGAGSFDLTTLTYLVDTRCEGSLPEHAQGPCCTALIPWFKSSVLTQPWARDWQGLMGVANRVAPEPDYLAALEKASSLLWLGLGRFLSYVPPQVVGSLDLRGCDVAILLGRANNDFAHQKQVYLDNRKSATELGLEAAMKTAELLLARGVKTVVCTTSPTTTTLNTQLLQAILANLASGQPIAEAVWRASQATAAGLDLEHVKSHVVVLGVPNTTASTALSKLVKGAAGAAAKKEAKK